MSEEKQILANKMNAQRSTGPKTEDGKAKSSLNSIKHGILSEYLTPFDQIDASKLDKEFREEFEISRGIDEIILEQLLLTIVKLKRCNQIERDHIKEALNPRIEEEYFAMVNVVQEGEIASINVHKLRLLGLIWEKYEPRLISRLLKLVAYLKERK